MSRRIFANSTTTNATVTTTTEEALVSIVMPGVTAGEAVLLIGRFVITTGADTSSFQARLREGTGISGTQVGEDVSVDTNVAGATNKSVVIAFVTAAYQDEPVYQLGADQVDATGNGTVLNSSLVAVRLD